MTSTDHEIVVMTFNVLARKCPSIKTRETDQERVLSSLHKARSQIKGKLHASNQ
jgi:hypothetical protein